MSREEEIRQQIRENTKDGYILQEMIRLGYWPKAGKMPDDPADQIRRRAELRKELSSLRTESHRAGNIARQLRELKKQRLKESREKRQDNKKRRIAEKKDKAVAWQEKQDKDIVYLGEEVSSGLNDNLTEWNQLESQGLPVLKEIAELAEAMEISVRDLRFLAFNRKVSRVNHYRRFTLAKKSGGERIISAPRAHLKNSQRWILENILNKVSLHSAAHGFKPQASILTNAQVHCGCKFLINIDLENFFPNFTFKRVKGMFKSLGYSYKVSTALGLLATEAEVEEMTMDDELWYIATGDRFLPQGSPASPAITNIICRSLDKSLHALAEKFGFTYSRYADDMSFSSVVDPKNESIGQFMRQLGYVVVKAGLKINKKKTRIVRQGGCREVTGLMVHDAKPHISSKKIRSFKALLFQIEKDGPEGKKWGNSANLFSSILGYAQFIFMVDKEKGMKYLNRVQKLIDQHGWQQEFKIPEKRVLQPLLKERIVEEPIEEIEPEMPSLTKARPTKEVSRQSQPVQEERKKPWWKFW